MTIEATFDFAARQVSRVLGDLVTWRPGTAFETEVHAVFGRGFDRVDGEVRVASRRAEIMVALSDLPAAPAEGDEVRIRDMLFEVATPQSDVESVSANLMLKRVT